MKGKFAKLFDLANGAQLLVIKDSDDEKAEEFQMVTRAQFKGITIKGTFGYKSEEKRNIIFEAFDEAEAERYYEQLNINFGSDEDN